MCGLWRRCLAPRLEEEEEEFREASEVSRCVACMCVTVDFAPKKKKTVKTKKNVKTPEDWFD